MLTNKLTTCGIIFLVLIFHGCGGGGSDGESASVSTVGSTNYGIFLDAAVEGMDYTTPSYNGTTDKNGFFKYKYGEEVTFKLNNIFFGKFIPKNNLAITPFDLVGTQDINDYRVVNMLRILQTMDTDGNPSNGIQISSASKNKLDTSIELYKENRKFNDSEIQSIIGDNTKSVTSENDAKSHFENELKHKSTYDKEIENKNKQNNNENGNQSNNNGGNKPTSTGYTLLAWNDLGMHCFDGSDFSVFSILPPYNNLIAQLKQNNGSLVTSGVTLTYESYNYLGHKNTISSTKTNFWDYTKKLFGKTLSPNVGLTGNKTPNTIPSNLTFNSSNKYFEATGIPLMNRDDDNTTNYYPMVKVLAKDSNGKILATAKVVLPVSDEMDCKKCHSSNSGVSKAKPTSGWVNNSNSLKDYKYNILRLHDERIPNAVSDNNQSLHNKGYDYNTTGLEATANSGTPILCASCHLSNALPKTGITGIKPLTEAIHAYHASVIDPSTKLTLDNLKNRNSCYSCHPGATTQCLRGEMGSAKNSDGTSKMQCQSCHGNMTNVGNSTRDGWLDEPNCQTCHQNGHRYTSALLNGSLRQALDNRFATNPDTPSLGKSLYKVSTGHGNLQCSACHGSTHAIYPSSHGADNVLAIDLQWHSGTISECTACHTSMPSTTNGGPHGMHEVGQNWVNRHGEIAEHGSSSSCTACHGINSRGSSLSKTFSARTFSQKTYAKGTQVSCYDCHSGPSGGDSDGDGD